MWAAAHCTPLHLPESPLLHHPRRRFVAFSAVGVAMVCLPLWQVLRYQQSDLQQLAAERALLDPVARAVHVQFGLLAHRTVAAQLLQSLLLEGQPQLEPARQAVQAGVDDQLQTLAQELAQGLWAHAGAETRDLTRDWQVLAQKVKARALTVAQSHEDHSLRVEQAMQVVDLVTMGDGVSDAGTSPRPQRSSFAAAARSISRLAAELPATAGGLQTEATAGAAQAAAIDGSPPPAPSRLQHRLQHRLQAVRLALGTPPHTPHDTPPDTRTHAAPLQDALADVERSTLAVLQAAHSPGGATAAAVQGAQRAQTVLFQQALGQQQRVLAQRKTTVQQQQLALLAALALLTTAALALAGSLWRRLKAAPAGALLPAASAAGSRPKPAPGHQPAAATDAAARSTKAEAQRVLDRLRSHGPPRTATAQPAPREPQDTLPPARR